MNVDGDFCQSSYVIQKQKTYSGVNPYDELINVKNYSMFICSFFTSQAVKLRQNPTQVLIIDREIHINIRQLVKNPKRKTL